MTVTYSPESPGFCGITWNHVTRGRSSLALEGQVGKREYPEGSEAGSPKEGGEKWAGPGKKRRHP